MKNPIAICLFTLGTLTILGAFIVGIVVANEDNYGFQFYVALSWWSSGIVAGIFLMGIGEIINLLQKLLDQKNSSVQSNKNIERSDIESNVLANKNHVNTSFIENSEIKIKDLTIILNDERFKGQFSFSHDDLKIFKKSFFENESEAQLIRTIKKNNISPTFEKNKDFIIFSVIDSSDTFQLGFKTFNIYDYQKIIDLLQLKTN